MKQPAPERLREASRLLRTAERTVRVLRTVAWAPGVRTRFLDGGARELPAVTYPPFREADEVARATERAAASIDGDRPEAHWIRRQADAIARAARMLSSVGTPDFFARSRELYGEPSQPGLDGRTTALGLAQLVDRLAAEVAHTDLGAPAPACHLAAAVAERMREAVAERFGAAAPEVVVVEELSANALAGPRAIRIRRDACFTDRDVWQLVQHEAFVHVCTSLNGQAQEDLPLLAAGHPGTTRTQEGLAVFAEFISGVMDPDRFRRLAQRVLAVQMAIDGADFLDVFRWFRERTGSDEQAFENARRVFRGGVLTGGAPFTKDVVYLDGLLSVTNFLRAAVAAGRSDCLLLLFCGKLDIEDVPALAHLHAAGLCRSPRFLPPWLEDRRFLVSQLTFSRFLNGVDLAPVRAHYEELLRDAPRVDATEQREAAARCGTAASRLR